MNQHFARIVVNHSAGLNLEKPRGAVHPADNMSVKTSVTSMMTREKDGLTDGLECWWAGGGRRTTEASMALNKASKQGSRHHHEYHTSPSER